MTTDTKYEYDIFISYNRADEAWARKLATKLEQEIWQGRSLKVFFAPWDIKPGESVPERLEYALPRSRKVGLILSPESVASDWVRVERYVTHHIDITERQNRLIPIYLRACEIPPFLNHINRIDLQDETKFEEKYLILLATIKDEPLPRGEKLTSTNVDSLPPAVPRPPAVGFVQRHDERQRNILEQVKEELAPEKNQLVVLWGRGGAGKTTLAAEAVREMQATFPERLVWISALSHADLTLATLLNEIAAQLGRADLRPLALVEKEEQVRALIAQAPALIVLDNFETIKPGEQKACVSFLAGRAPCPALITTRSEIDEDAVNNIPLDAMLLAEARELLRLLIERTRKPERFDALDHDDIIRKTEYNPLLLKWVVRQIDLARKPETALNYLAQGNDEIAERIFDRSFELEQVSDDARDTLLALSLFVPDASRPALAQVAGFGDDLQRLEKAIGKLSAVWLIDTTPEGERLLIRGLTFERAKVRLSKDSRAGEFHQRFIAHFLSYARAHAQPTPENYDALEAEKDNLLGATDLAFEIADWLSGMNIANVLAPPNGMLSVRGYWDEALRHGEQAAEAAQREGNELAFASFAGNAATIRMNRGEYVEAGRAHQQALDAFKKLKSEANVAVALHQLAILAQQQGRIEEARRLYNESLEIKRRLGDQNGRGIAITLHQLAVIAQNQGEIEEARRLYNESLEIDKKLGDLSGMADTLHNLATIAQAKGEITEARQLYDESLEIIKKLGDQDSLANTLNNLGILAAEEGNKSEAVHMFREALSIFERLGSPTAEITRRNLARVEGKSD